MGAPDPTGPGTPAAHEPSAPGERSSASAEAGTSGSSGSGANPATATDGELASWSAGNSSGSVDTPTSVTPGEVDSGTTTVRDGIRLGVRLGVDVGEARVGLAASDPSGILATPVATLTRDREGLADLDEIVGVARERAALEVIVGLPRTMSGEEGVAARAIRDYATALHRRLGGTPVRLVDERLTTVAAHQALHSSGVPGLGHRARVDQVAAVLILQAALDLERSTGSPPGEALGRRKPRTRRPATESEGNRP